MYESKDTGLVVVVGGQDVRDNEAGVLTVVAATRLAA